jgi:hypothetical protein
MIFYLANTIGHDAEKAPETGELSQPGQPALRTRWIVSRSIRKKGLPNGKALDRYSRAAWGNASAT